MVNIYIAGPFDWRDGLRSFAEKVDTLETYQVVARWLFEPQDPEADERTLRRYARQALDDIFQCQEMVLFTGRYQGKDTNNSQGRSVEYGGALGHMTDIIIVGEDLSIFHGIRFYNQANIMHVEHQAEAYSVLHMTDSVRSRFWRAQ